MGSYRDRFLNCTYCRMRGGPLTGVDGLGVLCQACLEGVHHNIPQALPGNIPPWAHYHILPGSTREMSGGGTKRGREARRHDRGEWRPRATSSRTRLALLRATRTVAPAIPRYRRMPAASDEDIARRQCHRHASIAAVRRSPDYVEVQLRSATGTLGSNIPEPPDPEDMRKSKRTWETNMQWWRRALKALATSSACSAWRVRSGVGIEMAFASGEGGSGVEWRVRSGRHLPRVREVSL